MKIKKNILLYIFLFMGFSLVANNVQVTQPVLTGQDATNQTYKIQFDIGWENSWKISATDPYNWDAVWVFAKYKVGDSGTWKHVKLDNNASAHSIGITNGVTGTIQPSPDSMGVFMYRTPDGTGNINWQDVEFTWDYSSDPDIVTDIIEVRVFAIEMVYIPQGSFYIGDGAGGSPPYGPFGRLHAANDINAVFHINSENGFYLGGTRSENLMYNDVGNAVRDSVDDFSATDSVYLSDNYPKGFDGFYIMKHELSQKAYVDFLNTLSRTQQNSLTATYISGTSITNRYVMSNTTTVSSRNGIKCDAVLPASGPVVFYNDLNGNDVYNEAADGQNVAMNYIQGIDACSYADWAGLRWMTELEYEKASRGPNMPTASEYAWGTTSYTKIDDIFNAGTENENSNTPGANYNYGNAATGGTPYQPVRPGIFATSASTTREAANASYYGVLDMSGNLQELCITIGRSQGRAYRPNHGDGYLESIGLANVDTWPVSVSAIGSSRRGGAWKEPFLFGQISNRYYGARCANFRSDGTGLRLVRSAP